MLTFFSIIFLASLFGIWYFCRKKPNKRLLIGTCVIIVISFLTIGGLGNSTKKVSGQHMHESSITKKERSSKAKKSSEETASSLAKEKSESIIQESSSKEASESLSQAESESAARTESERIERENSARAEAEKAQQENIEKPNSTETSQVTQDPQPQINTSNLPAPVNNGDMNTADANAQGVIVGNKQKHIYHAPGQQNYRMNSANAVYFNTEDEAQAAGYRKSQR